MLCWMMIVLLPLWLSASDTGGAMLYSRGAVSLNNDPVTRPTAIFPGDTVVTQASSAANIVVTGSNVMIQPDSIVKFGNNALELEHGTVNVATASGMKVRVGCVETTPVVNDWSEFEVTDVNGTVHILARKLGLEVTDGVGEPGLNPATLAKRLETRRVTLAQGQTIERDEHCRKSASPSAGTPPSLNGAMKVGGLALLGGLGLWLLLNGDDPVSPSQPCQDTQACR